MTRVEATAGGEAPVIEDGLYTVTVVEVTEQTMENDQFGHPEKLRFKLLIEGLEDEDGDHVYLDPLLNRKLSLPDAKMQSTLSKWTAIFGVAITAGGIDTDDFINRRAQALIQTAEPGSWPRVKDLLPLRKGAKAVAAKANHEHDPAYTATGDYVCRSCHVALDPRDAEGVDFTAFWSKVKALGRSRTDVAEAVGGDLDTLRTMTTQQLEAILAHLAVEGASF